MVPVNGKALLLPFCRGSGRTRAGYSKTLDRTVKSQNVRRRNAGGHPSPARGNDPRGVVKGAEKTGRSTCNILFGPRGENIARRNVHKKCDLVPRQTLQLAERAGHVALVFPILGPRDAIALQEHRAREQRADVDSQSFHLHSHPAHRSPVWRAPVIPTGWMNGNRNRRGGRHAMSRIPRQSGALAQSLGTGTW